MKVQFDVENRTKKREFQFKQPDIIVQHTYAPANPNHNRSKSYESEQLARVQQQKTKRQHSISQNKENEGPLNSNQNGFLSPKFSSEAVDLSKVTEVSLSEELNQKLEQKDKLIDDLQRHLTSTLRAHQQQLEALREEKNQIIEQQLRQIEWYERQLQECREESSQRLQEQSRLKRRLREMRKSIDLLSSTGGYNAYRSQQCACSQLERENQALLSKVDQLRQQLNELRSQQDFNNSIYSVEMEVGGATRCGNNQISVIEKQCDITHFEKTFKMLADELNVDNKNTNGNVNSSFSVLHQDMLLEGVKSLKQQQRENEKFIRCLKDLVLQCAPQDFFAQCDPSLKEVWKFIKNILQTYLENRKSATMNEDIISTLTRYIRCEKQELCHKTACLIVDMEVHQRIAEKVRKLLNLAGIANIRELDRKLEQYLH